MGPSMADEGADWTLVRYAQRGARRPAKPSKKLGMTNISVRNVTDDHQEF
ncbi:hypothetical protein TcasGA2_TC000650 [Tribolium castaneum]|uniref:Uncharacterized protein n=1 Tax=Tribolium castaneum TaxID=7070 RepID=D6W929_TRICA|nr:hypothetical protein TcasGA2_TC000650 [Tribolium castaneum]